VTVNETGMVTSVEDTSSFLVLNVLSLSEVSESPTVGDDNLLTSRELVLSTTKSFDDVGAVVGLRADREDNLTDLDAGNKTIGLSEGVSHTSLETIGSGTRKHFVDTENVVRVATDTHVEGLTSGNSTHVLVDNNTSSFESFGTDLFFLTGNQVDAERERIYTSGFVSDIKDLDLSIRYTTAVARFDVRLVLAVTVTNLYEKMVVIDNRAESIYNNLKAIIDHKKQLFTT